MVGSSAVDRFPTRRDERVTYILRAPEKRHRFGISALAVGKHELFTAGRDGTVRAWPLPSLRTTSGAPAAADTAATAPPPSDPPPVPRASKTFDEHVDWVNDVLLVHGYERIVSCSSDTTVKVWNANDPSRSLRTLVEHSDYVKALAQVPVGVASGSLDGRVLVWDLARGQVSTECGADADETQSPNGSVYCMSGAIDGNILVSGSTDRTISVWDVRTGDRVVHLRGHSDSVRCLVMKHDARYMLSGATDSTVKLWDLRQERCVRTFDSYTGSVWAITSDYDFTSFVAGGRDGAVWHTDMDTDVASSVVPVADEDVRSNMVLDVALNPCNSAVWVSTTGSTVRLWPLPPEAAARMSDVPDAFYFSAKAKATPGRPVLNNGHSVTSAQYPIYTIPGLPGIIAHRIMNNRRHVLTCDTLGEFKIWDITRGVLEKSLGVLEGLNIDEVLKKHDVEVSVPSWFQVDIRLGSLLVRLDKTNVANAEIYAVDAGLKAPTEEIKVNIGEHVIRGLFRRWLERYTLRAPTRVDASEPVVQSRSPPTAAQKTASQRALELPQYTLPDHIPVVVTEDQTPVPILRRTVNGFQGNEESVMPSWVVDLLRDGKCQRREIVKVSFGLEPAEGCELPPLSTSTLNAPRVLRVRKISAHVASELKRARTGLEFEIEGGHLEIVCNGQALPPTMSLATVRQFRWRTPEDLQLQYRLKRAT